MYKQKGKFAREALTHCILTPNSANSAAKATSVAIHVTAMMYCSTDHVSASNAQQILAWTHFGNKSLSLGHT